MQQIIADEFGLTYYSIVFLQEEDYNEYVSIINESGDPMEYLMKWYMGDESKHTPEGQPLWGSRDTLVGEYILSPEESLHAYENKQFGYASLTLVAFDQIEDLEKQQKD